MSKEYCSKCTKCITDEDGNSVSGMTLMVSILANDNREFIQRQLGNYTIGVNYKFCFECLLDTLFKE